MENLLFSEKNMEFKLNEKISLEDFVLCNKFFLDIGFL